MQLKQQTGVVVVVGSVVVVDCVVDVVAASLIRKKVKIPFLNCKKVLI